MSLAAPAEPSLALLRDLARRARPLHERMDAFRARPWPAPDAPCPEAARRLEAWRKTVVNGDAAAFALRLAWDGLDERTAPLVGPGWPDEGETFPVRQCLLIVLNEEWHHRMYAERDLAVLEQRG